MKTYQITLAGYDGGTDETDHLIRWINADSKELVDTHIKNNNLDVIDMHTIGPFTEEEGVDLTLKDK